MELDRIKELICLSSDVREDIIADLKARILEGEYEVKFEQVVERMIRHGIYMLGIPGGNGDYSL